VASPIFRRVFSLCWLAILVAAAEMIYSAGLVWSKVAGQALHNGTWQ
jgi:hypothetical protein